MKYFLHDSNSFNDEKITELFINFGYEGLGLFYTILEKLANQEKPIKTDILKHQLKVGKKLEKCWNFMESLEIISSNNGETFNKQLLNFSEKYKIKSEKNAKRILQWRENQNNEKNVTHSEHVRNAPKVKLSKVNRSKDIIYDFSIFKNDEILVIEKWVSYRNEIKKPLTQNSLLLLKIDIEKKGIDYLKTQIENSIKNGWQGLFEIKENNNKSHLIIKNDSSY